jgi:hypothetical protein
MDERERRKLVDKLKTVRTSEERDRILWQLAGQSKASVGNPRRADATGAIPPTPPKAEGKMQIRLPLGKLGGFGSITALLFLFYGMVAIVGAVMRMMEGDPDGEALRQLVTGGIFLFFGIVIFVKARRAQQKAPDGAA